MKTKKEAKMKKEQIFGHPTGYDCQMQASVFLG